MKYSRVGFGLVALAAVVIAVAGCGWLGGSSPTAAMLSFYEASRNQDATAMKKYLSKASIEMMEKMAKEKSKSLDEFLKEGKLGRGDKDPKVPEVRNEKIDGDKATLEVKDTDRDKWETIPFVKEDGSWKIALDKFMEAEKK
ncbi:MAG: DUF4878 domain-containing protein [Pyrinomonadaceae bacterium]